MSESEEAAGALHPDVELDCRGLNCPLPILRTKKALNDMQPGQVLRMVATDPGSVADVAAFCRRTGNVLADESSDGTEFVFYLRKRE